MATTITIPAASNNAVNVATTGALDGDGTSLSPLAVKVDGVTVTVNGDDELEAAGSITGSDTQVLFFDGTDNPAGSASQTYAKNAHVLTLANAIADIHPTVVQTGAGNGKYDEYVVIAVFPDGSTTGVYAVADEDGPTTLDGTHYIDISWSAVTGASAYRVYTTYRESIPEMLGALSVASLLGTTALLTFRDDGVVGTAVGLPTLKNTTAGLHAKRLLIENTLLGTIGNVSLMQPLDAVGTPISLVGGYALAGGGGGVLLTGGTSADGASPGGGVVLTGGNGLTRGLIQLTGSNITLDSLGGLTLVGAANNVTAGGALLSGALQASSISVVKAISSITSVTTTATVTTTSDHLFTTGNSVTVAGATGDSDPYNGTYTIAVTGATTFTYTFAGSTDSPAVGTMTASKTIA